MLYYNKIVVLAAMFASVKGQRVRTTRVLFWLLRMNQSHIEISVLTRTFPVFTNTDDEAASCSSGTSGHTCYTHKESNETTNQGTYESSCGTSDARNYQGPHKESNETTNQGTYEVSCYQGPHKESNETTNQGSCGTSDARGTRGIL